MTRAELVFIPAPGAGHLVSAVEVAKMLLARDKTISITFLIVRLPLDFKIDQHTKSLAASQRYSNRLRFIDLPTEAYFDPSDIPIRFMTSFIENHKPHVKEALFKLIQASESGPDSSHRVVGLVLDMFCTQMIDVANEFGVPSYIFFTSSATFLGLMFYIQSLHDDDEQQLEDPIDVPTMTTSLPVRFLPRVFLNKDWLSYILRFTRRFRETKGIIINTFMELESHAVKVLTEHGKTKIEAKTPPIYPVGPILNHDQRSSGNHEAIMQWLDDQPPSSVVFLCFGSMGSFDVDQVKEIALALERSGQRFLWSLRKPSSQANMMEPPSEYSNLVEVLPEGFLGRTAGIGKLIGWAPQVSILAHQAIGGFVSHCGWNSTLESLWFGVPIATLPIYSEQQFNAFQMAKELGLAIDIKMDHCIDVIGGDVSTSKAMTVSAEVIERGIMSLMDPCSEVRKKVKEMSEKSKQALMVDGSSHSFLDRLIEDMINHVHIN